MENQKIPMIRVTQAVKKIYSIKHTAHMTIYVAAASQD
jgi:hypothetical protein